MKAKDYPKARFCCMKCDKLLPMGAENCPHCGAVVADMDFTVRSNMRGVKLAAKEGWNESAPAREAARQESEKWKQQRAVQRAKDYEIMSVILVSTTEKKSAVGATARGIIGNAFMGPIGAIAGASTARSKPGKAVFSVKYASGRTAVETVSIDSQRFKVLAAKMHG